MNSPDDITLDFEPEAPAAAQSYREFLAGKMAEFRPQGFDHIPDLHPALFPHQRDTTAFLLRVGRGAAFLDTGLGKTLVQLDWARVVHQLTGRDVIILAPLAVAAQTVREGARFGIPVTHALSGEDVRPGINITNYERLEKFDLSRFGGVVLDESSILKSFMGKTKQRLCAAFANTPFRLCCTATPAPNDYMELGNHSDFLGIMPANEMLTRWFINDTMNFGNYRLKGHAVQSFWDWVCSWARCVSRPSDLGHDDGFYALPELEIIRHNVEVDMTDDTGENLFRIVDMSATEIHRENRRTTAERAAKVAEVVAAEPGEPWMIWCYTDYEADALTPRHKGNVADGTYVSVHGGGQRSTHKIPYAQQRPRWEAAMGINWMNTRHELCQAIPPAYSEWLGRQVVEHITKHRELLSA